MCVSWALAMVDCQSEWYHFSCCKLFPCCDLTLLSRPSLPALLTEVLCPRTTWIYSNPLLETLPPHTHWVYPYPATTPSHTGIVPPLMFIWFNWDHLLRKHTHKLLRNILWSPHFILRQTTSEKMVLPLLQFPTCPQATMQRYKPPIQVNSSHYHKWVFK